MPDVRQMEVRHLAYASPARTSADKHPACRVSKEKLRTRESASLHLAFEGYRAPKGKDIFVRSAKRGARARARRAGSGPDWHYTRTRKSGERTRPRVLFAATRRKASADSKEQGEKVRE